ncbi:hypothetical protein TrCOL_g9552 [Triparma columacea]|uniref:Amino acid transporter transmembrane domain-containing protein n=1 Tax=Triparma columacea TaxID=722753 RepID=A0A9W7G5I5_9STRA|nr:hypothetical protein TrCOL_g9552 [Triparma columacea]
MASSHQPPSRRLDSFTLHYYLDSNYSSLSDSTWSFTVMLLSSASMGLPYMISDLNPPLAIVLFFVTMLVAWYCSRILIMLADTRRTFYFDKLVREAFGAWPSWVVLLLSCTFSVLGVALNLRQTSEVVMFLLPEDWVSKNILVHMGIEEKAHKYQTIPVILFYAILNIPQLLMCNTLPSVSHMSLIALVFFVLIIPSIWVDIVPILESGQNPLEDDDSFEGGTFWEEWITPEPFSYKVVGTLLYVFGTSYNSLTIYNSLRMRRIERGMKVVKNGMLLASTLLFLSTLTAFIAYLPHHGGSDNLRVRVNILLHTYKNSGPGMSMARVFYVLFEFFKFPLDSMMARVAVKRFRRKFLQLFDITGEDASSNCHLELLCCCVGRGRGGDEERAEWGTFRGWFDSSNNGRRGRNSSENSSARQSHDVQGGGFVEGGGIIIGGAGENGGLGGGIGSDVPIATTRGGIGNMLSVPLIVGNEGGGRIFNSGGARGETGEERFYTIDRESHGGGGDGGQNYGLGGGHNTNVMTGTNGTNDTNGTNGTNRSNYTVNTDNDGVDQDERGEEKRRLCTISCGKRKITITLGLGTWMISVLIAVLPKMSSYIVIMGALSATLLGIIFPAACYMRLGPVNYDFGDLGWMGRVPNWYFGFFAIAFGVGAWGVSFVGGYDLMTSDWSGR